MRRITSGECSTVQDGAGKTVERRVVCVPCWEKGSRDPFKLLATSTSNYITHLKSSHKVRAKKTLKPPSSLDRVGLRVRCVCIVCFHRSFAWMIN